MTRVLVCGGRNYDDHERLFDELDSLGTPPHHHVTVLIHGGALGADHWANVWAYERGVSRVAYRADWKRYGKAAGPIRNQQMIDEGKPDLVIAFPGGFGTANMIRRAEAAGIEVRRVGG